MIISLPHSIFWIESELLKMEKFLGVRMGDLSGTFSGHLLKMVFLKKIVVMI